VIKNGRIIDGAGNPWFKADVAIEDGRVAQVRKECSGGADKAIDASGLVLCPGFIDMHNHSDQTLLFHKFAISSTMMGVTTMAVANCGHLPAPITEKNLEYQRNHYISSWSYIDVDLVKIDWKTIPEFYTKLESQGIGNNVAPFIGHNTLRRAVMGREKFGGERRSPTDQELEGMKRIVAEAMEWGALGMTTGLAYQPGRNSYTEELVELCRIVAKYDGIYMSHLRYSGDMVVDATNELIEIGEKAGLTVVGSHYKARVGGKGPLPNVLLKMIDDARDRGVDVVLDTYPWDRSAVSNLASRLVPHEENWTMEELAEKLRDPKARKKLEEETLERMKEEKKLTSELIKGGRRRDGPKTKEDGPKVEPQPVRFGGEIVYSMKHPEYVGKRVEEVAKMRGVESIRALTDLVLEDEGWTRVAGTMVEEDVQAIMKYYATMISTDSFTLDEIPAPNRHTGLLPHPRDYGTYPRVLGYYSRDLGLFPLEEAVRKMTSLPAQTLRLKDRGLLREGFWADVAVFNPKTVSQGATYAHNGYPQGLEYVLVNGQVTVERGARSKSLAGKILRRSVS
jgi:N-acyl-D-amino-acid deacylase